MKRERESEYNNKDNAVGGEADNCIGERSGLGLVLKREKPLGLVSKLVLDLKWASRYMFVFELTKWASMYMSQCTTPCDHRILILYAPKLSLHFH